MEIWSATAKTSTRLCDTTMTAVPWLDEPFDELEHLLGLGHAEGGRRLVHDDELGGGEDRLGHGDGLALAARE